MFYHTSYGGMHFVWWVIWLIIVFWIFVTPYDIPGQRNKKEKPIDILKRRFAAGEINEDEYKEMKRIVETTS